ncbi:MAG: hypothetical protein KGL39_53635 [Patescibacteria group bacterium]|nr:hypothetical protein [Patescibacteria group bacterium]
MTREEIITALPALMLEAGAEGVFDFILTELESQLGEIHKLDSATGSKTNGFCPECFRAFPCPTIRTLRCLREKPKAKESDEPLSGYAALYAQWVANLGVAAG